MNSAGIILNGTSDNILPKDDFIICADGGMRHALNIKVNCVIGDFDSYDVSSLPSNISIIKHKIEKTETDGELALRYAIKCGYSDINIYAALGDRIDHTLGNLALLAIANKLGANAKILTSTVTILYANNHLNIETKKGTIVSIIPFAGVAKITDSSGLKYPLENLCLSPFSSRGISNIALDDHISINVVEGSVFLFLNHL
ncbi:MAG: thiamine diphosphokinase [Christensenellaceae bacterium]|jgi:thiamine pyrophosphokinase|nr:thiamine diphosphokinase [Christensenellaceae bacterium]